MYLIFMLALCQFLVGCQFQMAQKIKSEDQYEALFDVSEDFKYMVSHSNKENMLSIYESYQSQQSQIQKYILYQQLNMDAQIYSTIQVSGRHNIIVMGASRNGNIKILSQNQNTHKFETNRTMLFSNYGIVKSITSHPIQEEIIALGFSDYLLLVNFSKTEESVIQQLSFLGETIKSISFSFDGKFLAAASDSKQIYIFKLNNQSSFQAFNAFGEQKIVSCNFVSTPNESHLYNLIVTLENSISIYYTDEGQESFELQRKIHEQGFINGNMDIIVEWDSLQVNFFEVYRIGKDQTLTKTEQLDLYKLKKAFFNQISGDLIVEGAVQIILYKYCFVDFCQSCQIFKAQEPSQTTYVCIQCSSGYQAKSNGAKCLKCNQYPSLCKNCNQENICSQCIKGYTIGQMNYCIPCHIQNCLSCHENERCKECEQQYVLDGEKNICLNKGQSIPLVGIIVGTIIGAVIVVVVCLYVMYEKAQSLKLNQSLLNEQNDKRSRNFRERARQKEKRKKSFLYSNQDFQSLYEDYSESQSSEEASNYTIIK